MELALIFGRLVFSSASSVYQKKLAHQGLHPFPIVAAIYAVVSVLVVPLFVSAGLADLPAAFWWNVLAAALLDAAGWLFMVLSLSKTDLSVFGPLNAYKVVFSMLLAMAFLGEIPSLTGVGGIAIILLGSFLLTPPSGSSVSAARRILKDRGVQARFVSIALFSVGTVYLKSSVILSGAVETLIFWTWMGVPLILLGNGLILGEALPANLRSTARNLKTITAVAAMVFLMQYFTLILLSRMHVAYALALFQIGMVLHVFLGHRVFKEEHFLRRLTACLIMVLGSTLVLRA